jgi:chromate reductase, NAD(P)H dehydrogenase (quinone)
LTPGEEGHEPMRAKNQLDVVVICGSLREGSYNAMVANSLPELAPDDMAIRFAPSFEAFPIYNADLQDSSGFPPAVTEFADAIRDADGIIVVTPEYNFSIPGGLKNALDWVSRLDAQPFAKKPVAIQSASPSPLGGGRVQYHLRQLMVFLDALVLNKPEIFVSDVAAKVDEKSGELTDDETKKFLRMQLQAFAKFIRQVGDEPRIAPERKSA